LRVVTPWMRATPPGATAAAGYLTIVNEGSNPAVLAGVTADFADKGELHEMKMDGDVMTMRPLEGGIEIAPGATIELMPGASHAMFTGIRELVRAGETLAATLDFGEAGKVTIDFKVVPLGAPAPAN
jgi:copper(I)-binding protein